MTDANNKVTRFGYDPLGRRLWRKLPAGQTERWQYDLQESAIVVNKQIHIDFSGNSTRMEYDSRGRLQARIPLRGSPDTRRDALLAQTLFTYTPTGQRQTAQVVIPGITPISYLTRYFYDSFDRLWIKSTPEGDITYTYDLDGRLLKISSLAKYNFDAAGNPVLPAQIRPKGVDMAYVELVPAVGMQSRLEPGDFLTRS